MKKRNTNKGITLIALIITIIVMLILVAVTISMAVNGGLFDYAGKAVGETEKAINFEQQLADGRIQIGGVWYDSIDDYLAGIPSGPVKIKMSISGTKVTNVPIPTGFKYKEGTINTGYVIVNETDGNEFVWVPVDKNQKISLSIESEKDVKEVKLYDPAGEVVLILSDNQIETTYSNTEVEPTINGVYALKVTTEDEIVWENLIVKSLYAIDEWGSFGIDYIFTEEFVTEVTNGEYSKEEFWGLMATQMGYESLEVAMQETGCSTLDEFIEVEILPLSNSNNEYEDLENYTESVNNNGGFYIGRYEAGTTTSRTSGNNSDTVDTIKTANGIPVLKEGMYPYNFVTFDQAIGLAESMYDSDSYEVSLLTGSAWDRTLDWIYETGNKSVEEICENSKSWGNYHYAEFEITKGQYFDNTSQTYKDISAINNKKENAKSILLTTGATTRNSANNIFDLAGNIREWTNETNSSGNYITRGGFCDATNVAFDRAESRVTSDTGTHGSWIIGFRPALYLH